MNRNTEDNDPAEWTGFGDWQNGRVRSGAKAGIWISLLFGLVFTGIGLPATLALEKALNNGNYAALLVLMFPLIGLGALGVFIHQLMAWRKFGRTELVLDPVPGSLGGDFGGYVDIPAALNRDAEVSVTLNCLRSTTSGSGKNRSTSTRVLWQREGVASTAATAAGTRCSFRFAVPDDLPASEKSSSRYHHWQLHITCELPGIDFSRTYTVPVFHTPAPLFSGLKVDYARNAPPLQDLPQDTVRISETAGGLRFYYPWQRHLASALILIPVGAMFAGPGLFILPSAAGWLFAAVFAGVGLLLLLIGLYLIGNTLTTTVSPDGVNVVRNIYGLRFQRNAEREQILTLEREIRAQLAGGRQHRVFYAIIARCRDGRRITVADALEGSRLTDHIENRIREVLKLPGEDDIRLELRTDAG